MVVALPFTFDPSTVPRGLLPPLAALDELRTFRQWVAWNYVEVDGRQTKVPFNPANGRHASTANAATWGTFHAAEEWALDHDMAGVGFVLAKDGAYIGGDLDKCIGDDGVPLPWARDVLALAETYAELSPSGRGIRMFMRGELDHAIKTAGVELYSWGRYLTVTGRHIAGTPTEIREAPKTLAALMARVETVRAAAGDPPAPQPASEPPAGINFRKINDDALADLSWVPSIFPAARYMPGTRSYRVSSKELGRDLEEDLSIAPTGIIDFGVHDMGDPRQGKRTAITTVMEHGGAPDAVQAARWLVRQLEKAPEDYGLDAPRSEASRRIGEESARNLTAGTPAQVAAGPIEPLESFTFDALEGEAPAREWHVPDLVPAGTVTLLGGDGATGKSLLALQLAAATAAGGTWIGREVRKGRSLYLSAEDETRELHRRRDDICRAADVQPSALSDLRIIPMAGKEAIVMAPARGGILQPTQVWQRLCENVRQWQPRLVVLDTLADLFAGNENSRSEARQFVQLLIGMALQFETTVILLGHPSLAGLTSGSGASGSTAWNNSVRSRLYLERVRVKDGDSLTEPDPDLRVLSTKKANYTQHGEEMRLRWQAGVFVSEGDDSMFATANRLVMIDMKFIELLRECDLQGQNVGAAYAANYAPKVFANHPKAQGITVHAFKFAMQRLFDAGRIQIIEHGPISRRLKKLAEVNDD